MRKQLIARAKASPIVQGGGRLLDAAVPGSTALCTVLTFHRIDTGEPHLYPGLAGVDPAAFERFVGELADRFRPIGVDRLVAALDGRAELPNRSVLVTFDDAYRDFRDVAWPVLRSHGVPVVLFVPTAYPGDPTRRFWWDELYGAFAGTDPLDWQAVGVDAPSPAAAFRSIRDSIKSAPHDAAMATVRQMVSDLGGEPPRDEGRVLGWDELRTLADEGVTLAPHSRTHPMLDRLPPDDLDGEIRGSLDDLREHLGSDLVAPVFAYPSGGHDPTVRAAVRRAGFDAAFTTERGLVDVAACDRSRLPRLNVGSGSSVGVVAAEASVRRAAGLGRRALRRRRD